MILFIILSYIIGFNNTFYIPDDFKTIQSAINTSINGDIIIVRPGVYNEKINLLGKKITLQSEFPDIVEIVNTTILDGNNLDKSIIICSSLENEFTQIRGFTIKNGAIGTSESSITRGGAIYCRLSGPTIEKCIFVNNKANFGGAIASYYGWPTIRQCSFIDNIADKDSDWGGGAIGNRGGDMVVDRCVIKNNTGILGAYGGGISIIGGSTQIVNSLITNNVAYVGGAISNKNGEVIITNCTIANNIGNAFTNGIISSSAPSNTWVRNCILWNPQGNSPIDFYDGGGSQSTIDYSNLSNTWVGEGANNISINPQFISPLESNFSLLSTSECLNVGNNIYVAEISTDLVNHNRIINNVVDLGCYEISREGDINGDDSIDFHDILEIINHWGFCENCASDLNFDQIVDFDDLLIVLNNYEES